MPARCTTWVTPSSIPDQSAAVARSGSATRSTSAAAMIADGSRAAART
nr:hypothetical protein [Methyloceanibacter superfactus]